MGRRATDLARSLERHVKLLPQRDAHKVEQAEHCHARCEALDDGLKDRERLRLLPCLGPGQFSASRPTLKLQSVFACWGQHLLGESAPEPEPCAGLLREVKRRYIGNETTK
jgi:hypothetical protein